MSQLKVFLSYSSEDKVNAGDYKRHLEKYYGFQVFIAHEDNTPACDWNPEIKTNISRSDIFIVLISESSEKSVFVNQEIGIAIGLGIKIFPIKIDQTNPFGFIYKIQGFPYIENHDNPILINGSKLFSILTSNRKEFLMFGDIAIESAAYALANSAHFRDSNIIIKTLIETETQREFNNKHIELLKSACQNNYEVYGGAFEYSTLKRLLENKYNIRKLR